MSSNEIKILARLDRRELVDLHWMRRFPPYAVAMVELPGNYVWQWAAALLDFNGNDVYVLMWANSHDTALRAATDVVIGLDLMRLMLSPASLRMTVRLAYLNLVCRSAASVVAGFGKAVQAAMQDQSQDEARNERCAHDQQ